MSIIAPHWVAYSEAKRRGDHDEAQRILDQHDADDRAHFVKFLRHNGHHAAADSYVASMKELDSGRMGARATWHSISPTQREVLAMVAGAGAGKMWRDPVRPGRYRCRVFERIENVLRSTVRSLASRDLLAWDGGAFDPEAVAVVTERGRFVAQWGSTSEAATPREAGAR